MDIQSFRQLKAGDEVKVVAPGGHALRVGSRATVTRASHDEGIETLDVLVKGVAISGGELEQYMLPGEIELAEPLFEVVAETTVTVVEPQVDRLRALAAQWRREAQEIRPVVDETFGYDSSDQRENDALADQLEEHAAALLAIVGED